MNRTGSSSSLVPPAETSTRLPLRSAARPSAPRASTRTATPKSSVGSGSRPGPLSAPVRRPVAGSSTIAPRSRNVATFACVAGCCHISVCMAGANTTGQRAVSRTAVSRSSDRPAAARASRSAVAGATKTRSAVWPSRTCGTLCTSSQTPDDTGSPESAAQVASPTKRSASGVGATLTWCPASVSSRSSSQDLYAAMPAPTPRMTRTGTCPSRTAQPSGLRRRFLRADQPLADLAQRDRQRLLLDAGLNKRANVLQQAFAELGVVGVDLPCPLRRHDDEAVLAVHHIEQIVDGRVDDAFPGRCPCHFSPSRACNADGGPSGPAKVLGYQAAAGIRSLRRQAPAPVPPPTDFDYSGRVIRQTSANLASPLSREGCDISDTRPPLLSIPRRQG